MRTIPRGQLYFSPRATLAAVCTPNRGRPGRDVASFEAACARLLGAEEAAMLPHARVALLEILRALALPPGAEVVMAPVTIPDVVNAILQAGLQPRFVDLGARTGNLDPSALEAAVSPRTAAVLLTPLCGLPPPLDRILPVVRRHGLVLLEDGSQAMGATFRGQAVGTFGEAGFFSLTTLKPLATFQGGLVVTGDRALAGRLRAVATAFPRPPRGTLPALLARDLVLHALTRPATHSLGLHEVVGAIESRWPGWVSEVQRGHLWPRPAAARAIRRASLAPDRFTRYTDAQARMGLEALASLAPGNATRAALSRRLLAGLEARGVPGLPHLVPGGEPTFWRFPLWVDDPVAFRRRLHRRGIDSAATNLPCLSRVPAFADLATEAPHAEAFTDRMVFLPMHPNLTPGDVDRMVDAVAG